MKKLLSLLLFLPLFSMSQGIKFEEGLTWEQIKQKAKIENKYIFVDAYATWCVPCKKMDKEVYSNDSVGNLMNSRFVSLKLQMDTGKNDNAQVVSYYGIARELEKRYSISAFPTYLFFSENGEAIHKDIGGKSIKEFLKLSFDVEDSTKQLYTLINKAHSGKMHYDEMPAFARKLKGFHKDEKLANEIASIYIREYLNKLTDDDLCVKQNLLFLQSFSSLVCSADRIFKLYFIQPGKIDSIMSTPGYSRSRINGVIYREEVYQNLIEANTSGRQPDFKKIQGVIKRKYNKDYAIFNVLNAKQIWFEFKKDWENYINTLMKKWQAYNDEFSKYGWLSLNTFAWKVCVYSNDKKQLKTALAWINMAIPKDTKQNTAMLDTKANILYKLGYIKDAIALESLVVEIYRNKVRASLTDDDKKNPQMFLEMYEAVLEKMKKGLPIDLNK